MATPAVDSSMHQDVRGRILTEAIRLFGLKGFGGTSVREVVDAAGVTKPTLYYWFASKEALFLEAIDAQVTVLRQILADTLQQEGSVVARLNAFVQVYVESAIADADGCRLMMTAKQPTHGQPEVDLMTTYREVLATLTDVVAEGIRAGDLRDGLDPCLAGLSLLGSANLHIVAALEGLPLPEDVALRIVHDFLHGVSR